MESRKSEEARRDLASIGDERDCPVSACWMEGSRLVKKVCCTNTVPRPSSLISSPLLTSLRHWNGSFPPWNSLDTPNRRETKSVSGDQLEKLFLYCRALHDRYFCSSRKAANLRNKSGDGCKLGRWDGHPRNSDPWPTERLRARHRDRHKDLIGWPDQRF